MDSFANTDVDYPDGQSNRVVVPAEIQARGFKPPVRTASGELEKGDSLAANHLNYILNDIYKKLSGARQLDSYGGDSNAGYRKYTNGDVDMWGGGTAGSDGNASITYPVTLPAVTRDIQLTMLTTSDGASMDIHQAMVIDASQTVTGFRARCIFRATGASSNQLSQNGFRWRASYHATKAVK